MQPNAVDTPYIGGALKKNMNCDFSDGREDNKSTFSQNTLAKNGKVLITANINPLPAPLRRGIDALSEENTKPPGDKFLRMAHAGL